MQERRRQGLRTHSRTDDVIEYNYNPSARVREQQKFSHGQNTQRLFTPVPHPHTQEENAQSATCCCTIL